MLTTGKYCVYYYSTDLTTFILYRFILVDLGQVGRHSDGGTLANSEFGKALENGSLQLPTPSSLSGTQVESLYVIVAYAAFPLQRHMLKPYPGRNIPGNY